MVFNHEYDMDRENRVYFKESHPIVVGRWYVLEQPALGIDGTSVSIKGSKEKINWEKHLGHFVQVIGYQLPMRTDHCGMVDLYCKQCKKAFESVSTQFLREINHE